MSTGVDVADLYRRSAAYVDRILRGAQPGELPIQAPTSFKLVLNLKTAKSLGIEVSQEFLLRACGRTRGTSRDGDRRDRRQQRRARRKGGDLGHPDRVHAWRRSGHHGARVEPLPTGRERDRRDPFHHRGRGQALRVAERAYAEGRADRRPGKSELPNYPRGVAEARDVQARGPALGLGVDLFNAATGAELEPAFASIAARKWMRC